MQFWPTSCRTISPKTRLKWPKLCTPRVYMYVYACARALNVTICIPEGYAYTPFGVCLKAGRPKVDRAVEEKERRYVTHALRGMCMNPFGVHNVSKKKKKKYTGRGKLLWDEGCEASKGENEASGLNFGQKLCVLGVNMRLILGFRPKLCLTGKLFNEPFEKYHRIHQHKRERKSCGIEHTEFIEVVNLFISSFICNLEFIS